MLPVKRGREERADTGRAACNGNRSSCQSKVHWLLDWYHAHKDKVVGAFVGKTVNRLGLDVDGVVWADMTSLPFAESSASSLDDENLMFPGVCVPRRRSTRFDDEVPHGKRRDSVRAVEHPSYRCATGSGFSNSNLLDVLDCLDNHDDLQLDYTTVYYTTVVSVRLTSGRPCLHFPTEQVLCTRSSRYIPIVNHEVEMFKSQSLDGFLTELSSRNPTPGGGTAAGLAAAMGAALAEMVANVVGARDEAEKSRLAPFVEGCEASRAEFVAMMDQDSAAFEGYMTAVKLPKTTDDERLVRRGATQDALKGSTRVPLALAVRVCDFGELLVTTFCDAPRDIASDLYVGAAMLEAAYAGAIANVYVNLAYLRDPVFKDETRVTVQQCQTRVAVLGSFKDSIGRLLAIA
jgi:methenyltetrahydrofolate cyclohydrolase